MFHRAFVASMRVSAVDECHGLLYWSNECCLGWQSCLISLNLVMDSQYVNFRLYFCNLCNHM